MSQSPSAIHALWEGNATLHHAPIFSVDEECGGQHFPWHAVVSPTSERGDAPVTGVAGSSPREPGHWQE